MSRPGVLVDVVPAERTLMAIATFDDAGRRGLREFVAALRDVDWAAADLDGGGALASDTEPVELPVIYDGPDLNHVARLTSLAPDEIIALHSGAEFTVAFTGFAPGFAYLTGLPEALRVPRRDAPRTRVPAGAVALGGPYAGVYPRESPGGWQLIGQLAAWAPALWDETRSSPALLRPGTRVRFRDASGQSAPDAVASTRRSPATDGTSAAEPGLRVVRAGPLTTVQDLGRPGFAHLGVPRSGAVDRTSLKLANRLVGNAEDAAALELTFGGTAIRLEVGRWVAVAGARCEVTVFGPDRESGDGRDAREDADSAAGSSRVDAYKPDRAPAAAGSSRLGDSGGDGQSGAVAGGAGDVDGGQQADAAVRGGGDVDGGRHADVAARGAGDAGSGRQADAAAHRGGDVDGGRQGGASQGSGGVGLAGVGGRGGAGGGGAGSSLLSPAPSHQQMILRTVPGTAFYAPGGAVVDVGSAEAGVRAYLAVAGGLGGGVVLGSRAVDLLSGVGGRALRAGDFVGVGVPEGLPPDIPGLGLVPLRDVADPVEVRLVLGPRSEWFGDDAVRDLVAARWVVGTESNRTAVRLEGPALRWARDVEPASEPLVVGAVQVPRDGRPVLFLADHPVTGGYPVIACAHPADLDAVGQALPGTGIRFRMVGGSG